MLRVFIAATFGRCCGQLVLNLTATAAKLRCYDRRGGPNSSIADRHGGHESLSVESRSAASVPTAAAMPAATVTATAAAMPAASTTAVVSTTAAAVVAAATAVIATAAAVIATAAATTVVAATVVTPASTVAAMVAASVIDSPPAAIARIGESVVLTGPMVIGEPSIVVVDLIVIPAALAVPFVEMFVVDVVDEGAAPAGSHPVG